MSLLPAGRKPEDGGWNPSSVLVVHAAQVAVVVTAAGASVVDVAVGVVAVVAVCAGAGVNDGVVTVLAGVATAALVGLDVAAETAPSLPALPVLATAAASHVCTYVVRPSLSVLRSSSDTRTEHLVGGLAALQVTALHTAGPSFRHASLASPSFNATAECSGDHNEYTFVCAVHRPLHGTAVVAAAAEAGGDPDAVGVDGVDVVLTRRYRCCSELAMNASDRTLVSKTRQRFRLAM